jgi:hypothetical protein
MPATTPHPIHVANPQRRRWLAALASGLALAGSGCAGPGPGRRTPPELQLPPLTPPSYGGAAVGISHVQGRWPLGGEAVPVDITAPSNGTGGALVVYLPGLGEGAEAGVRWHQAWAAAGHTVLSVQPLAEDALAWRSELARASEFRALARERHASSEMQRRLDSLLQVLTEARRRAAAGEPLLRAANAPTLVLAGHDLGAYTAMAAAGERLPGVRLPDWAAAGWRLAGVLAISPHAEAGADPARYGAVQVPVLSITSTADRDFLGLVDSPQRRAQPFDHLTGAHRWLLTLDDLPHAALAGDAMALPPSRSADAGAARRSAGDGETGGHAGGAGRRRSGGQPGGDGAGRSASNRTGGGADGDAGSSADRASDNPADSGRAPGDRAHATPLTEAVAQRRLDGARTVSSAFIDAVAQGDGRASAWLAHEAADWVAPVGRLRGA